MEKDGARQVTADDDSTAERPPEASGVDATRQGETPTKTSSPSPRPVPEEDEGDGQNSRPDDEIMDKEKDAEPEEDDGRRMASPQSQSLRGTMSEDNVEQDIINEIMSPDTRKSPEHSDLDITPLHEGEPGVVEEHRGGGQNDRPDKETTVTASDAEPAEGEAANEMNEASPTHAQTVLSGGEEARADGQKERLEEAESEEVDGRSGRAPQKARGPSPQPGGEVSPAHARYNLRSRGGGDGPSLTPDRTTAASRKDVADDRSSKASPQRKKLSQDKKKVVTLVSEVAGQPGDDGHSSRDTPPVSEPPLPGPPGGATSNRLWIWISLVILGVAVALGLFYTSHQGESLPQKDGMQHINAFLKHMDKLKTRFPNQRDELWKRSRIHLSRHLQTAHPTEPVSLILTADIRAKQTLLCLAESLAAAFSSAIDASFIYIDGASKASQDSDQVKLDIDSKLQGAFEGGKPVALIHRFEELPPGSTLIFYRYCDHENAAYKKTFLIFTVLLGEEIPATCRLSAVEEMVDDHLQRKFLSDGLPVSFDRMDIDKYGGLWSRISHLILPVAAEAKMEHEGCQRTL